MKKTTMVFDPELHAQIKEYAKENCRGNVTLAVDILLRDGLLRHKLRKHKEEQENG